MLENLLKKRNKKGFTLVELVIVIAILAILVAVAIPTISHLIGNANQSVDDSNANMIQTVIKTSSAEAAAQTLDASIKKTLGNSENTNIQPSGATEAAKTVSSYTLTVDQLIRLYGLDAGVLNVKSNTKDGAMVLNTNTGKVTVGTTTVSSANGEVVLSKTTNITFKVDGTITAANA